MLSYISTYFGTCIKIKTLVILPLVCTVLPLYKLTIKLKVVDSLTSVLILTTFRKTGPRCIFLKILPKIDHMELPKKALGIVI